MARVGVVTCSAACIPRELADSLNISIVPLSLIIDDKPYMDGIEISTDEFYRILEEGKSKISTSAPSPGRYLEVFKKIASEYESILCLTVTSKVSGDYASAKYAAGELEKKVVEVIDSGTAATGLGQAAVAAARAAAQGASFQEVKEEAMRVISEVRLFGAIETFEYLRRSGRVNSLIAFTAEFLNIKPVFELYQGEIRNTARTRSKIRALEKIASLARERYEEKGPINLAVFHATSLDEAHFLKERIFAQAECNEVMIAELTPVMGLHTGPGLVGASFY